MTPLLTVANLHLTFFGREGELMPVLRGVSFEIEEGEIIGLVGESGSGKTATALAIMGLQSSHQCRMEGEIRFERHNLVNLGESRYRSLRGKKLGMIFQDSTASLNPTMKVGRQVKEAMGSSASRSDAIDLLASIGIPCPNRRYHLYPHQLSGGMCQRVMVAMAIGGNPRLLIADEPTTALDAALQEQILELLKAQQRERGMSLLLITHDIGLIARHTTRTLVMYAGQIVEKGPTPTVLASPQHPYTRGLLDSVPSLSGQAVLRPIPGAPPNPCAMPSGCAFTPRCPHALRICGLYRPPLDAVGNGHRAACWLHDPRAKEGS